MQIDNVGRLTDMKSPLFISVALFFPASSVSAEESDSSCEEREGPSGPEVHERAPTPESPTAQSPQDEHKESPSLASLEVEPQEEEEEEEEEKPALRRTGQQYGLPSSEFSGEPAARQSSLQRRKEVLLQQARRSADVLFNVAYSAP